MVFITSFQIQTVLRQYVTKLKRTRRKGNHARKFNNKTESNSNSNEKAKKETSQNQNKTPTDPPPSTNAHAEWIMRNQHKSQIACDLALYLLKYFKIASTIRSDARPSPYGLDAFDILS